MYKYLLVFLCCVMMPVLADNKPPQTVPYVDIARYMGKWYEIARIPNSFQKSCRSEITATYQLLANGQIQGVNTCRKANGQLFDLVVKGTVQDKSNAKIVFKITSSWLRWIPMLSADYWVVDLASDYRYAAVSTANHQYVWLLARQPQLSAADYQLLLERLAGQGFDVSKIIKNKQ